MHQVDAHEENKEIFVQISNDYCLYQIQQTATNGDANEKFMHEQSYTSVFKQRACYLCRDLTTHEFSRYI
jgi:hypothetical protein